jgi:hypothetical protein
MNAPARERYPGGKKRTVGLFEVLVHVFLAQTTADVTLFNTLRDVGSHHAVLR